MTDLYEAMGVDKNASRDEIKRAYRDKAKTEHPDAGGSEARFQEIQIAYATLKDEDAREKYDRTGEGKQAERHPDAECFNILAKCLMSIIEQDVPINAINVVTQIKQMINAEIQDIRTKTVQLQRMHDRCELVLERLESKTSTNILQSTLQTRIRDIKENVKKAEEMIATFERANELLDDYKDNPDDMVQFVYSSTGSSSSGTVSYTHRSSRPASTASPATP